MSLCSMERYSRFMRQKHRSCCFRCAGDGLHQLWSIELWFVGLITSHQILGHERWFKDLKLISSQEFHQRETSLLPGLDRSLKACACFSSLTSSDPVLI